MTRTPSPAAPSRFVSPFVVIGSLVAVASFFAAGCDKAAPEPSATSVASPSSAAPAASTPHASASTPSAGVSATAEAGPAGAKSIPGPDDVAAPPKGAKKTSSGLAYKILKPGDGKAHPGPTDRVKVDYTGWTTDGKMFDSSVARGEPATFRVDGVIKGWTEGLQLMTSGEKARFWIPAKLAYGEHPGAGMPAGMLVFDVELLDIIAAPKPPPVPEDVKGPPANATKTASGLAYRILQKGKGTTHPGPTDRVTVNYTGWTTDGKMFDSSVTRGQPASFSVGGVIKGWTEGLQLMTAGEKARFWIPANLAYGDHPSPGAPAGMLVFDIELISIP